MIFPALLAGLLLPAGGAQAATACSFDADAAAVTVEVGGAGASARLSRGPTGAILLDGAPCGAATTRTADAIAVTGGQGPQQVLVDLSGGLLAPGKTAEPGETSEIELTVDLGSGGELPLGDEVRVKGAATADYVRFGARGAFLTADGDADLATTGVEAFGADGGAGNDRFLGTGDGAGGPASALPLRLDGGDGADTLAGGAADDIILGGAGNDAESGGDGRDRFVQGAAADGRDVIDGGGSPFDVIDYTQRAAGVRIDLDGVADDGAAGELDNVKDAVEFLLGGAGADTIVASATRFQPFELRGGAGDDKLTGGTSSDLLYGDAGDDELLGLAGSDTLDGGADDDRAAGDAGADLLAGGTVADGADDLSGGTGVDTYDASGRTKAMIVSTFADSADDGEAGEGDRVRPDVDRIHTGSGDDKVATGDADDYVSSGAGDDVVDGAGGDDELRGGFGGDALLGGDGADFLQGSDENDRLDGGEGDDVVHGDADDDTLRGGTGEDMVLGGEDQDVVVEPPVRDPEDVLDGGLGIDRISYAPRGAPVAVSLDDVPNDGHIDGEFDNARGFEDVTGGQAGDALTGNDAENHLDGSGGSDRLKGLDGDDRLVGGTGGDALIGDAGRDLTDYLGRTAPLTVTLNSSGAADDGAAGEGDDVRTERVAGGSAADRLTGDGAANTLMGGGGRDTLDGGLGADRLDGGEDDDTVSYATRGEAVAIRLDATANDGAAAEGDYVLGVEHGTGGGGADTLVGDARTNVLKGGPGADTLDGRDGADVLDGEDGRDTADYSARTGAVYVESDGEANDGAAGEEDNVLSTEVLAGGAGDDQLVGGLGDDELRGGKGHDRMAGAEHATVAPDGDDVFAGGEGQDTADYSFRAVVHNVKVTIDGVADDGLRDGGEADDVRTDVETVIGTYGPDELHGSNGSDTLVGGWGADVLFGEGGDDRFDGSTDPRFPEQDGDVLWGGPGFDTADYSKRTATMRFTLDGRANDGMPAGEKPAEADNVQTDVEALTGGSGTDWIYGNAKANRIDGGKGVDALYGGGEADEVLGGEDNDGVNGGSGNDRLHGGPGANTLSGGDGDDVFVEAPTPVGNDWFIGGGGRDAVDYSARAVSVVADNDMVTGDDGQDADGDGVSEEKDRISTDVEVMHGGSRPDRLTQTQDIPDTCAALYGNGGEDTLKGSDADEVLQGGDGRDHLHGGDGDDHLVGGPGNDVEHGDDGFDVFIQGAAVSNCAGVATQYVAGPDGADELIGGGGDDAVDYTSRRTGVSVTLDEHANDGAPGEGDKALVRDVRGGDGDDTIVGDDHDNWIRPGAGKDKVWGRDGADHIVDRAGRDVIFGEGGSDVVFVNDGDGLDQVDGGSGFNDHGEWDANDVIKNM